MFWLRRNRSLMGWQSEKGLYLQFDKSSSLRFISLLITTNVDRNGVLIHLVIYVGCACVCLRTCFAYAGWWLRNLEKERVALGRGPRRMKKDVRNIHIGWTFAGQFRRRRTTARAAAVARPRMWRQTAPAAADSACLRRRPRRTSLSEVRPGIGGFRSSRRG